MIKYWQMLLFCDCSHITLCCSCLSTSFCMFLVFLVTRRLFVFKWKLTVCVLVDCLGPRWSAPSPWVIWIFFLTYWWPGWKWGQFTIQYVTKHLLRRGHFFWSVSWEKKGDIRSNSICNFELWTKTPVGGSTHAQPFEVVGISHWRVMDSFRMQGFWMLFWFCVATMSWEVRLDERGNVGGLSTVRFDSGLFGERLVLYCIVNCLHWVGFLLSTAMARAFFPHSASGKCWNSGRESP